MTHNQKKKIRPTRHYKLQNLVYIPRSFIRTRAGRTRTGSDILVSVRTFFLFIILLLIIYYITTNFIIFSSADEGICPSGKNISDSVRVRPALSPQASAERDVLHLPFKNLHRAPVPYISSSDVPCPPSGYSWFQFLDGRLRTSRSAEAWVSHFSCLLYTSPSPRDRG